MCINPGPYEIQNVTHRTFAIQSQENTVETHADRIVSSFGRPLDANLAKTWSISRLDNNQYTIRNIGTEQYAASANFPAIEGQIITKQDLQQWDIKETGVKGRYVIYTTVANIDLFWGLANGRLRTPISLRDTPNTPSNQWELRKVDSWTVVGALRLKSQNLRGRQTKLLDDHTKLQEEHTRLQEEHAKIQEENAGLRSKHKSLQDERAKLGDGVERLNADVAKASLDAQQERARHVQAEAELVASHERASRRERARHLQAEAELKAYYEKLLAECGPKTSQRRCTRRLLKDYKGQYA
ncbi:hypothetical protein BD410DRAFT_846859 [Rickenella mellea]|uniref:Ricin B lectin domain-containing protein n=1 Tax=Rickenella mellea TaxID=50990 RepID=A0A4Y7PE02_9AGAM|nr:hypothetical protein BD410DRAFT_846859 [Rickenella mellea]